MSSEKQYIDLYCENRELIDAHSAPAMNALREDALAAFQTLGFPSRKMERYKYTDVATAFAPDYGVNLKRFGFPVNPYDAFRCGVPNLSTSLYFMLPLYHPYRALHRGRTYIPSTLLAFRQSIFSFSASVSLSCPNSSRLCFCPPHGESVPNSTLSAP